MVRPSGRTDLIFRFDVSRDGRYLLSRGRPMRDVVLMSLG
jgi:hypothetical protein